jgi:hypothetical protein
MNPQHLNTLSISQRPASPPRFKARARMHGLMSLLVRHHDLTAVMRVDGEFDIEECRRATQAYCRDVVLMQNPYDLSGVAKRLLQLRSVRSGSSSDRLRVTVRKLQPAADRIPRARIPCIAPAHWGVQRKT